MPDEGGLGELLDFSRIENVWILTKEAALSDFIEALCWFLLGHFFLHEEAGATSFHPTTPGSRSSETALYRTRVSPASVSQLMVESTRV